MSKIFVVSVCRFRVGVHHYDLQSLRLALLVEFFFSEKAMKK